MKTILLLLLLSVAVRSLFAQDTIRSLVITEARLDAEYLMYLEITNMGEDSVQLNQFEIGQLTPWGDPPYSAAIDHFFRLPDTWLLPGNSFLMCSAYDDGPEQYKKGFTNDYPERMNKLDLLETADLVFHFLESGSETDIVY